LLLGVGLSAVWVVLGVFALFPTIVVALIASFAVGRNQASFPFGQILVTVLAAGLALRVLYGVGWLPALDEALFWLAQSRPLQSSLADEVLAGESAALGPYLMLVLGEATAAGVILYLAKRPGLFAGSFVALLDRILADENVKPGVWGLLSLLIGAGLCWFLITVGTDYRRIDYAAFFLPVAPICTCFGITLGWHFFFRPTRSIHE
jgi:hypothetical protein